MGRRKDQPGEGHPGQEGQGGGNPNEGSDGDGEATDQATDDAAVEGEAAEEEERPKYNWKFKERLPIYDEMSKVINLTIKAAEKQLEADRRKLRKIQYGG